MCIMPGTLHALEQVASQNASRGITILAKNRPVLLGCHGTYEES